MKRAFLILLSIGLAAACGPKKPGGVDGGMPGSASRTVRRSSAGATSNPEALKVFKQGVKTIELGRRKGKATHQAAIKAFKRAASLDGNFAEAHYNLGVVYEDLDKLDDARRSYGRATKAKKDFTEAYVALGRIYVQQGKTDKAKNLYAGLLSKDPNNTGYKNQLVVIYRVEKNYPAAIKQVRDILFKNADNVEAYKNLSGVYMDMGKYDLAKLVCANALKLNAKDPGIYNNLGLIYLKQNDPPGATGQFDKALKLNPNYMPALLNRAALALDHMDYRNAQRFLKRVLVQKPFDVQTLLSMAVAKRGLGENDAAKKLYKGLIEADPTNPEPVYNLGVLYHLGYDKPKEALKYYASYLEKTQANKRHPVHRMTRLAKNTLASRARDAREAAAAEAEMKAAEAAMAAAQEKQRLKQEAAKRDAAAKKSEENKKKVAEGNKGTTKKDGGGTSKKADGSPEKSNN